MKNNWLTPLLAQLREGDYPITRLQGNPKAAIFVIAPPPTEEYEVKENLAWCSPIAAMFFELVNAELGWSQNEFLIMPASFRPQKTKVFKASDSVMGTEFVQAAANSTQIRGFVCVGATAYKAYIGHGKKPSMEMLMGNLLYTPVLNYKPMVVCPDLEPLLYEVTGFRLNREQRLQQTMKAALQKQLERRKVFQNFRQLVIQ